MEARPTTIAHIVRYFALRFMPASGSAPPGYQCSAPRLLPGAARPDLSPRRQIWRTGPFNPARSKVIGPQFDEKTVRALHSPIGPAQWPSEARQILLAAFLSEALPTVDVVPRRIYSGVVIAMYRWPWLHWPRCTGISIATTMRRPVCARVSRSRRRFAGLFLMVAVICRTG